MCDLSGYSRLNRQDVPRIQENLTYFRDTVLHSRTNFPFLEGTKCSIDKHLHCKLPSNFRYKRTFRLGKKAYLHKSYRN